MDSEAVAKILQDFYVDDLLSGSRAADLDRLVGDCQVEDDGKLSFTGSMAQILALGGFRFKAIVTSQENHPECLKHLGQVLGHDWDPKEDTLSFKFGVRAKLVSKKEAVITQENIGEILPTKRNFLGVSSQFYDPMGICVPCTISFKIAMKEIIGLKVE